MAKKKNADVLLVPAILAEGMEFSRQIQEKLADLDAAAQQGFIEQMVEYNRAIGKEPYPDQTWEAQEGHTYQAPGG